jgi:hypothetical protein
MRVQGGGRVVVMSLTDRAASRVIACACCVAAVLTLAPVAAARVTPIVPPANGAGNEYLETLPGPGGGHQLGSTPGSSGPGGAAAAKAQSSSTSSSTGTSQGLDVAPTALQTLAGSGEAGRVVRDLAPRSRPRVSLSTPATAADSPASSAGSLIVGRSRSGLGIALPIILGVTTLAAIAFAVRRRLG